MGSREKDAFSGLMASVPGVDTSGFVKRSLNDMKGRSKAPKPKIVSTSPTVPSTTAARYASTPAAAPPSHHGVSIGARAEEAPESQPRSVSPAWDHNVTKNLGLSDLDALNSWQSTAPVASGSTSAATPLGDLFDGIPGAEATPTEVANPPPQVPQPRSGDLLGLGDDGLAEELGAVTIQHNPSSGTGSFEYSNMATQEQGSFGGGSLEAFEGTHQQSEDFPSMDKVEIPGFGEFASDGHVQEAPVVVNGGPGPKYSSLDSDFAVHEFETYGEEVVENGAKASDGNEPDAGSGRDDSDYDQVLSPNSSSMKKKLGRISPQMSTAAKNLLAKVSRTGHEARMPSHAPAQAGKSRFTKYRDNFQKKAVQYSKIGLDAVKQGFGAASDWMDKQLEDRKKSGSGSPKEWADAESEVDIVTVAMDLEALSPMERSLVLEQMNPKMRQRVIDLFHSQGVSVGEEDPQPTTPNPFTVESRPSEFTYEEPYDAPPQSEGATGQRMTRYMSDPDFSRQEVDLGRNANPLHAIGASAPDLTAGEFPVQSHVEDEVQDEPGCDFLGLDGKAKDIDPPTPDPEPVRQPTMADPEDLDSFFGGGPSATSTQAENQCAPPQSQSVDDIFGGSSSHQMSHGISDDLMDMGQGASSQTAQSEYSHLYEEKGVASDEPAIRKMLREKRIREKHNKMQEALQEKLMKEQEEVERQEVHYDLKKQVSPKILEWKDSAQGNIRGLLTSLHTVLWEGSGWKELTVGDVLESNQVKKAYRKANLLVHPDKVRQKNGTDEQIVVADMLFDILKESWGTFEQ
ncbi:hypothetical protein BSKO_09048 [Bryopsis sp. KO-2023]|nr:hypothetical protein BSKO_09048 [Bryopsis sp. KO-2023]